MPSPANPDRQHSYHVEISTGLARRLRETRLAKGMSTAGLAKAAGVGRTTILNAEAAERGGAGMSLTACAALRLALSPHRDPLGENGLIHEHRKALKQEEPVLDFA